jgi:hypothetical protein
MCLHINRVESGEWRIESFCSAAINLRTIAKKLRVLIARRTFISIENNVFTEDMKPRRGGGILINGVMLVNSLGIYLHCQQAISGARSISKY